jgi:hypothetical protein
LKFSVAWESKKVMLRPCALLWAIGVVPLGCQDVSIELLEEDLGGSGGAITSSGPAAESETDGTNASTASTTEDNADTDEPSETATSSGSTGSNDDDDLDDDNECGADLDADPSHCGACGHDCLGGECTDGTCQPVVVLAVSYQTGPLVNDDDRIFWLHRNDRVIRRVSKQGSEDDFFAEVGTSWPAQMTYGSGRVYISSSNTLWRVDAEDGAVEIILTDDQHPYWNGRFALDDERLYFADIHLYAMPLDGGDTVQLSTLIPTNAQERQVAVDANRVYRSVTSYGGNPPRVYMVPKTGGVGEVFAYTGDAGLAGLDAGVLGAEMSWGGSECSSTTWFVSVSENGTVTNLATTAYGGQMHPDAAHVYFTDDCTRQIMRVPRGGGAVETLTDENRGPITIDEDAVYFWRAHGLMKVAK